MLHQKARALLNRRQSAEVRDKRTATYGVAKESSGWVVTGPGGEVVAGPMPSQEAAKEAAAELNAGRSRRADIQFKKHGSGTYCVVLDDAGRLLFTSETYDSLKEAHAAAEKWIADHKE